MSARLATSPVATFLVLFLASSAVLEALAMASGFSSGVIIILMWSVGLSAMAALKLTGRPLAELGWAWGPAKHHLIAFALPVAYCAVAYGVASTAGLVSFPATGSADALIQAARLQFAPSALAVPGALLLLIASGMVKSMATALGEEIGWRGFLAPRAVAWKGFAAGAAMTGALWAVWHMPLIAFSGYNGGGDVRFELASFAVTVVSITGPMTWLRLRSRSLWPCAVLHASHNFFVQELFDPLTRRGAGDITMVGEFGVVFAAVVLVVCLPFWILGARRRAGEAATA